MMNLLSPTTKRQQSQSNSHLPIEIKLRIIADLNCKDIGRLAQVDRSWAYACGDLSLWQRSLVPKSFRHDDKQDQSLCTSYQRWMASLSLEEKRRLRCLESIETEDEAQEWLNKNKSKPGFAEAAVFKFPQLLSSAPYAIRDNPHLVAACIAVDGRNISYGAPHIKDNEIMGLYAVSITGWAIEYLSERLRNRPDIRVAALNNVRQTPYWRNWQYTRSCSSLLSQDPDFAAIVDAQKALNA